MNNSYLNGYMIGYLQKEAADPIKGGPAKPLPPVDAKPAANPQDVKRAPATLDTKDMLSTILSRPWAAANPLRRQ